MTTDDAKLEELAKTDAEFGLLLCRRRKDTDARPFSPDVDISEVYSDYRKGVRHNDRRGPTMRGADYRDSTRAQLRAIAEEQL